MALFRHSLSGYFVYYANRPPKLFSKEPAAGNIAHIGAIGAANSKTANQASADLTTNATIPVGRGVVITIAVDNNQITDGDEGSVTGITDPGGNEWLKGGEETNGQGAAQAGVTCSVWFCPRVTTQIDSGSNITVSFSNAASRDASAITGDQFSLSDGKKLALEGTNPPAVLADDAANPGSLNLTTANIECLRYRGIAGETAATGALTPSAGWTGNNGTQTSGGAATDNVAVRAEFIINTATNAASAPALGPADHASVYIAFKEVYPDFTGAAAITETGADTGTLTGAALATATAGYTDLLQDSPAIAGNLTATAALGHTDSLGDTPSLSGGVTIAGTSAASEIEADTPAIAGGPNLTGGLSSTETGLDLSSITGGPALSTGIDLTESGQDVLAIAGGLSLGASVELTEAGADTPAIAGGPYPSALWEITESGLDASSLTGEALIAPIIGVTELLPDSGALVIDALVESESIDLTESGADLSVIGGSSSLTAEITVLEGGDSSTLTGGSGIQGEISCLEIGADTASLSGTAAGNNTAAIAVVETGQDEASGAGEISLLGGLSLTEGGNDSATINGLNIITVAGEVLEPENEGGALIAESGVVGIIAVIESGGDTTSITGAEIRHLALSVMESGADSAGVSAGLMTLAGIDLTESGIDQSTLTIRVDLSALVDITEQGSDVVSISSNGPPPIYGALAITELLNDSIAMQAYLETRGHIAGQELGADLGNIMGAEPIVLPLSDSQEYLNKEALLKASLDRFLALEEGVVMREIEKRGLFYD